MATKLQSLAQPIAQAHPIVTAVGLDFGDCHLRVETNSTKLAALLSAYFRQFLGKSDHPDIVITALQADEAPLPVPFVDWVRERGKTGRKDEYADIDGGRAVRKVRTGMQYLIGGGNRLVFGDCRAHDNQVINFVIAQYINWLLHRGTVLAHAAGVVRGASGLALAGISGAGKSTLALHLMTRGLSFASNDRLLIGRRKDGGLGMHGVPKQPRINPGTALSIPILEGILAEERRRELQQLAPDQLWELEEKYDVDIATIFGEDRWCLDSRLDAFLVLRWHRSSTEPTRFSRVDLGKRPDVLDAITKPPGPFYEGPEGTPVRGVHRISESEYMNVLDGLPVYEATGRVDFAAAVQVCLSEYLTG